MEKLKDRIEGEIEELEDDGLELYFRVSSENDDMQGNSVELQNVDRQEAADIFDVGINDLDEFLEEKYLYYDDGKDGVYWDGICVTSDISQMAEYYRGQQGGGISSANEGVLSLYLFILSGDFLTWTEVGDGEVIENPQIIKKYPAQVLRAWF